MATEQQVQANKTNAQRSTGPRTAAGKRKSSLNAVKHGLRAQQTVLPGENRQQFQAIAAALVKQFKPATAIEWTLLRQLADAEWRMRRVPHIEAGLLFKELLDTSDYHHRHPDELPEYGRDEDQYLVGCMAVNDSHGADVLSKLSRYESRLSHRYFKALVLLHESQDRRRLSYPTSAAPANSEPAGSRRQPNARRRTSGDQKPKQHQK